MSLKLARNSCCLKSFRLEIPIAILEIKHCTNGLHQVDLKEINLNSLEQKCVRLLDGTNNSKNVEEKSIKQCIEYFENYFSKKNPNLLKLPNICWSSVCIQDTFAERVLHALAQIKFGDKISYSELAFLAGSKNAQRAVGTVMRNNKIVLILPCHRVVKSNDIGNYGYGVDVKYWLLEHESCLKDSTTFKN